MKFISYDLCLSHKYQTAAGLRLFLRKIAIPFGARAATLRSIYELLRRCPDIGRGPPDPMNTFCKNQFGDRLGMAVQGIRFTLAGRSQDRQNRRCLFVT
jgi:hypothetical protein